MNLRKDSLLDQPERGIDGSAAPARRPVPSWWTVLLTTLRVSMRRLSKRRRTAFVVAGLSTAAVIAAAIALWPAGGTPSRPAMRVLERTPVTFPPTDLRSTAVRWVRTQVGKGVVIACDSAVCSALTTQGVPTGSLVVIGPARGDIRHAEIVVDTSVIRNRYGPRLASLVTPHPLVRFGSGANAIDVRQVVPDGLTAYRARLAADLRERRSAGRELLKNRHLTLSPTARAQLLAGRVDDRLLAALGSLSSGRRLVVARFADGGVPAVSIPYRTVLIKNINGVVPAKDSPQVTAVLRYLNGQRPGDRPAATSVTGTTLTIRYAAPSPLGLLSARTHR